MLRLSFDNFILATHFYAVTFTHRSQERIKFSPDSYLKKSEK